MRQDEFDAIAEFSRRVPELRQRYPDTEVLSRCNDYLKALIAVLKESQFNFEPAKQTLPPQLSSRWWTRVTIR